MIKNKIALKLSMYFAIALLVFSIVIGSVFIILFRNHTIYLHKSQLLTRANSIAATLSGYLDRDGGMGRGMMMGGYGMYFQFIGEIAGADVWVIDQDFNLITSAMGHGMKSAAYEYSELPQNADSLIKEVFTDKTVFSEDFSGLFSESTLTVGTPIKSSDDSIIGVVLIHSPINGINEAISQGGGLLVISLCAALAISFLLTIWLSKSFTDPIISKEAQDALRLENIRRDFVANISHELRTPVTVIRGSLEALVDKVVTNPVQIENYHKQILQEAIFLQRLVGDLLDLSKLQNVDFIIEKQEISVCDVLDDIVRSVSQISDKKAVQICVDKGVESCMVHGDYGRIRQMIMIILDNAIKFSPENSKVEIALKNQMLSIRDYGAGIPTTDLPRIFDRFYKSRSEQNKTGTGLGLAIAKQIANRHGMELSVQNNESGGATFIINMSKK